MCVTHEIQKVLRIRIRVKFLFVKSVYIQIIISGDVSCLLCSYTSAHDGVPLLLGWCRNAWNVVKKVFWYMIWLTQAPHWNSNKTYLVAFLGHTDETGTTYKCGWSNPSVFTVACKSPLEYKLIDVLLPKFCNKRAMSMLSGAFWN